MDEDMELLLDANNSEDEVVEDIEENNQPVTKSSSITYDTTLPVSHSYLGTDLEEMHGRTVLVDDTVIELPVIQLRHVVLFPGQTLPLHLFQQSMVSMMRTVLSKDRTFGILTKTDHSYSVSDHGTTAEVVSYREESDDQIGLATLRLKAVGRQRFKLLSQRRQVDGVVIARVQILPEVTLSDPLSRLRLDSHAGGLHSAAPPPSRAAAVARIRYGRDGQCVAEHKDNVKMCGRYYCSYQTQWPSWLYRQYDTDILMRLVRQELRGWNEMLELATLPTDPSDFSFWVAANLPLPDDMKLDLLAICTPVQRLRQELDIMRKCTVLCCRHCGEEISNKQNVFCLSVVGPLGAYVNPHGFVHETLTVCQAKNLALRGRPSTEHSWFPGYAWTIIECKSCSHHLGWKFTASKSGVQPAKFWGLCRASISPGLAEGDVGDEGTPVGASANTSATSFRTADSSLSDMSL